MLLFHNFKIFSPMIFQLSYEKCARPQKALCTMPAAFLKLIKNDFD